MRITCGNMTMNLEKGMTVMQCLQELGADLAGVLAVQQVVGSHNCLWLSLSYADSKAL